MAPTRKSRSVNKRYADYVDVSPSKTAVKKSGQQKRKLSDMLGSPWADEEVERFYKAYRKYGKDWKKVASMVRTRNSEMAEALYTMNRAYLSLPEGTASVVGFIAMVSDHYNAMEGSDNDKEVNDFPKPVQKPKKRTHRLLQQNGGEDQKHSRLVSSSDRHLPPLKIRESDGCTVRKRTPRFPINHLSRKETSGNPVSPYKKSQKREVDDVAHGAALALTEALQRGGSPQVSQSPYRMKTTPPKGRQKMLDTARSKLHGNLIDEDCFEGSSGSGGADNVGGEVYQKGRKFYGQKDDNEFDDGGEACSGTGEGLAVGIEVADVNIEQSSLQGKRKGNKKLFFRDETSGLDALETLANLSLMIQSENLSNMKKVQISFEAGFSRNLKSNLYLPSNIDTPFPIFTSIFKHHPLKQALTKYTVIPEKYVVQTWKTLTFVKETNQTTEHFFYELSDNNKTFYCTFTIDDLRASCGFPGTSEFPGKEAFDDIPEQSTMLEGIKALGYDGDLTSIRAFNRSKFSQLWCVPFTILSRCFSGAETGFDSMTTYNLPFMYGFAYHQHFDCAKLLWDNLKTLVKGKGKERKYVPFVRFLSLVIAKQMYDDESIPENPQDFELITHPMVAFRKTTGSVNVEPMQIPKDLLDLVPNNDPFKVSYLKSVGASMGSESRQTPTHDAHRTASEGPSVSKKRKRGEKREGKKKKRKIRSKRVQRAPKRSLLRDEFDSESTQSEEVEQQEPQEKEGEVYELYESQEYEQDEQYTEQEVTFEPETEQQETEHHSLTPSPQHSPLPSFDSPEMPQMSPIQSQSQPSSSPQQTTTKPDLIYKRRKTSAKRKSKKQKCTHTSDEYITVPESETEQQSSQELQGRTEGGVENTREVERSGSVQGQKERDSPPETTSFEHRDEPIGLEDESSQLSRALISISHCGPSLQESLSIVHGNKPRHPLPLRLEVGSIKLRRLLFQPPTFISSSLESRSPFRSLNSAHLGNVAGTSRGNMRLLISRGLLGNPVNDNVMPSLYAGDLEVSFEELRFDRLCGQTHELQLTSVQTGSLSDPGLEVTPPSTAVETTSQGSAGNPETVMMSPGHLTVSTTPPELGLIVYPLTPATNIPSQIQRTTPHSSTTQTPIPESSTTTTHQPSPTPNESHESFVQRILNLPRSELLTLFHIKLKTDEHLLSPIEKALLAMLNAIPDKVNHLKTQVSLFHNTMSDMQQELINIREACRPA